MRRRSLPYLIGIVLAGLLAGINKMKQLTTIERMFQRCPVPIALFAAAMLAAPVFATGSSSTNYALPSSTLNAGGGNMASASYKMSSSLGDSTFSGTMTSSGYRLSSGFWGFVDTTVNPTDFISQSNCLFNWAEGAYPNFFAPATAISNTLAPYYYRFYPQTNAYLGTSSADSHVYYLGPLSNNSILDVGALSGWLSTAGCQ